jgi:hypothetical protein
VQLRLRGKIGMKQGARIKKPRSTLKIKTSAGCRLAETTEFGGRRN